jgi:hypothetical protein
MPTEDANANEGNGSAETNTNAEIPSSPEGIATAAESSTSASALPPGVVDEGAHSSSSSCTAQDALVYEVSTDSNIAMQGGRLWQAAALVLANDGVELWIAPDARVPRRMVRKVETQTHDDIH